MTTTQNHEEQTTGSPIFNDEYEMLRPLGDGNSSKVYLCRSLTNPTALFALKIIKDEFLDRSRQNVGMIEQEISILRGLKHRNVVGLVGYGTDGQVVKSGRRIRALTYILLEYVPDLLFDVCQQLGGIGEGAGRFFMAQLVDVLGHMHQERGVVHRDLKLENILVDANLNLKLADFGFATFSDTDKLNEYRGTKTYMAPEIKECETYDGKKADVFSIGVILFIIVQGFYPFKEAKRGDYFYDLLIDNKLQQYWRTTGCEELSAEFKDLLVRIFARDPEQRPTVEEVRNHPWMQMPFDHKEAQENIIALIHEKQSAETAATYTDIQVDYVESD